MVSELEMLYIRPFFKYVPSYKKDIPEFVAIYSPTGALEPMEDETPEVQPHTKLLTAVAPETNSVRRPSPSSESKHSSAVSRKPSRGASASHHSSGSSQESCSRKRRFSPPERKRRDGLPRSSRYYYPEDHGYGSPPLKSYARHNKHLSHRHDHYSRYSRHK